LTARERETFLFEDEFPRWLATCDEQLAAGAPLSSALDLDAPAELKERLEREVAWCETVRRMWRQAASAPDDSTAETFREGVLNPEPTPENFGRFLVRRELGRGAFGVVSLAYDPRLRRAVALKVPRAEVVVTPELRKRFRHEAMAAAGLDHPNIVPLYEAGEEGSVCYIASAYCRGTTLAVWLRERSAPVPPRTAAALVATLAQAVAHAHGRGILHRDLKPSNVLLEELAPGVPAGNGTDLVPRVTDFGLAKVLDPGPGEEQANPTLSGVILGTPAYMAPEQADGRASAVGPSADI
jgi:serine/threonine protein kinase